MPAPIQPVAAVWINPRELITGPTSFGFRLPRYTSRLGYLMRLGCAAALPDRNTTAFASFSSGAAGGGSARFRKSPGRRGAEPVTELISYRGAEIMHLKF